MAATCRRDGIAGSPATMDRKASRRRKRIARSMATRVWIAAPMWRKMSILSNRLRRGVAKHAKARGFGSHRRMPVSHLPLEIVTSILSWLPVKSLMRVRCVCKEWSSLTYNPNFIEEHHTCARALGRLALVSRGWSSKVSLYDFGDNGEVRNQAFNMGFEDPYGYTISNPVNGLVGIECYGSMYLLNPATRELAILRTSGKGTWGDHTSLGLGFDSSTGGYKLVKLFHVDGLLDGCGCKVLELGTQEWREVGIAPCMIPATGPILLNGALNWIACGLPTGSINFVEDTIMSFNLKDENFRAIPIPVPAECRAGGGRMYLGEWGGLLCIVMLPCMYRTLVRIWRLEDYENCRWMEAHCSDLPNHACIGGWFSLVGIRCHEMLIVENLQGGWLRSLRCYDLRTRRLRELNYNEYPSDLNFLTESLVSPRYLAGNPSLH